MFYPKINHCRRVKGRLVWNKREAMGWMIKKPPEAMGRMGISTGVCVCVYKIG